MAQPPVVSIVIPCYRQAQYLPEAVLSVIMQRFTSWEIIIVDDGSPDNTAEVAQRLIDAYPIYSIRLIRQTNQGPSASRNTGIRAARGEIIVTLDADDMIAPNLLAHTLPIFTAAPQIGFVYTDVQRFGGEATRQYAEAFDIQRLKHNCTIFATAPFRRVAWEAAGGFRETRALSYEDWEFWLRLVESGWQGAHVPEPLLLYRRNPGTRLSRLQAHDLELRAQVILNHRKLYEAPWIAWAEQITSAAYSHNGELRSDWHRLAAFVWYNLLVLRSARWLLPRTLLRPIFWHMPMAWQGALRGIIRHLVS